MYEDGWFKIFQYMVEILLWVKRIANFVYGKRVKNLVLIPKNYFSKFQHLSFLNYAIITRYFIEFMNSTENDLAFIFNF